MGQAAEWLIDIFQGTRQPVKASPLVRSAELHQQFLSGVDRTRSLGGSAQAHAAFRFIAKNALKGWTGAVK